MFPGARELHPAAPLRKRPAEGPALGTDTAYGPPLMPRIVTLHIRAAEGAWVVERDGDRRLAFPRCDAAVSYACGLATHLTTLLDRPRVHVRVTNLRGREFRVR